MANSNFSEEKWMEYCRKYNSNKVGLGFDISFRIDEEKKGHIKFKNLDSGYQKAMTRLVQSVIQGMLITMSNLCFSVGYAKEEDQENQYQLHSKEAADHAENYINILLNEGVDKALSVFLTKQQLIQIAYEAANMSYCNGTWETAIGDLFVNNCFIDHQTQKPYSTDLTEVWNVILGSDQNESTDYEDIIDLGMRRA